MPDCECGKTTLKGPSRKLSPWQPALEDRLSGRLRLAKGGRSWACIGRSSNDHINIRFFLVEHCTLIIGPAPDARPCADVDPARVDSKELEHGCRCPHQGRSRAILRDMSGYSMI